MNRDDRSTMLKLRKHMVDNFDQGDWASVGMLTGCTDEINRHPRLLRSLSFGDPDYTACVAEILHGIVEKSPENLQILKEYMEDSAATIQSAINAGDGSMGAAAPTVFEIPKTEVDQNLVSVMMPFSKEFQPAFKSIKAACDAAGFDCKRADDVWEHETLIQDIFSLIYRAKVVVCDFSGRNPNVFYEAGIAHTLGRTVIPLTQSKADVPFDLQRFRYIRYLNNTEGLDSMQLELTSRLLTLSTESSNPPANPW